MAMGFCNKCLEKNWFFKKLEGAVLAVCQYCGNEVEFSFEERGSDWQPGMPCPDCKTPLKKRQHKLPLKPKVLKRAYHFNWWCWCQKCKKVFHNPKAKVEHNL